MDYELVTAGTFEPITLAEAKTFLRIPSTITDHDDEIMSCVRAAREVIEDNSGHICATSTWKAYLNKMPSDIYFEQMYPITAVSSITYFDGDNQEQTLSSSNYFTVLSNDFKKLGRIYISDVESTYERPNAVTINFTAGYTSMVAVPEKYKRACKYLTKHFYDQNDLTAATVLHEVPKGFEYLLQALKRPSI